MTIQKATKEFNDIYNLTYSDLLKYIIIKCHNVNDTNDIIQETYLEFWKILNRKEIDKSNIKSYLIGIAINKIKKHYSLLDRLKITFLDDEKLTVNDNVDIEDLIIEKNDWNLIWNYIKNKRNQDIPKVFYLHYRLGLSIKDISKELDKNESYIKNLIYRTLKELSTTFGKECE